MATSDRAADAVLSEGAFHMFFLIMEEHKCLWRIDHEGYKNVAKKGRIWNDICKRPQERFPNLDVLRTGTLPNKTILCTFGNQSKTSTARPEKGLCDIIFWDYFYKSGRGTFLDRSSVGFQWFLEFARIDSGTTQFGIGIDHGNALGAYDDLNKADGRSTFTDLWKMNIRHYGLLKFQAHATITNSSTVQDYNNLLKRLRGLQEVNRAGDVKKFGYIILGVDLFAPRTSDVYSYLDDLLWYVLRLQVDALDYVKWKQQFTQRQLMVSFSMATVWSTKQNRKDYPQHYSLGASCTHFRIDSMYKA
ncbi:uncharacterized protein LOC120841191 [Ixodes scapularis]|uniref:uncharacterized protein LOC120841191 n=1 Tax=Ixodes scapularis TaxID=6945 RepID=UPI001C38C2E9|nr:uncharacterized protein LOC120841191 [Ixodes scapularis]